MPSLEADLRAALIVRDKTGREILYRFLQPTGDIDAITEMLHEAYAPLLAAGMRYMASYQDAATTSRRMAKGDTVVALDGRTMVGVITLKQIASTVGSPFYERDDVASVSQFAVRPSHQRHGIGGTLLRLVEQLAREKGVAALGLDTSEHAAHLIAMYDAKGYAFVEHVRWTGVNYRSVVLAKRLV